jgi:hypothetical protein
MSVFSPPPAFRKDVEPLNRNGWPAASRGPHQVLATAPADRATSIDLNPGLRNLVREGWMRCVVRCLPLWGP